MVMIATSSRASGCWDSLGCPCGIFFERDPWKSTFFRYKTGSISVTGSLAAARKRVYDTNPPLVGLLGVFFLSTGAMPGFRFVRRKIENVAPGN